MPPIKVLLFIDTSAFAGTERHILDLARELRAQGARVEIGCPPGAKLAERAAAEQIPLMTLPCSGRHFATAVFQLRKELKAGRWDVVHAHNGKSALLFALARIGVGTGAFLATQHFVTPARQNRTGWKAALAHLLHRWVEGKFHRVVAISEAVKMAILERGGPAASRTRVVLNGIQDPQTRSANTSETWRSRLGLSPATPIILSVSRLEPEKNLLTLLEAMALLAPRFPTLQCLIAGIGSEEIALREKIEKLRLTKSVHLLGFQNDPHTLMREADVFVLPSPAEPFGLVIVEAMAMECPVVAVAEGGPLEIVQHGETGFLIPGKNPVVLADAAGKLLVNPNESKTMGRAGRQLFLHRFTAQAMAEQMLSVYEEALHGLHPSPAAVGQTPTFRCREIPTSQSASRVCR